MNLLLGIHLREANNYIQTKTYAKIFIEASFVIAKN